MRALLLVTTTLLLAGLGALLGFRLARQERTPPPEPVPLAPLPETSFARIPLGQSAAEPGPEPMPGGTAPTEEAPRGLEARWAELNRMAIRALDAGDLERAVAFFQQCAEGVPDEPVFRRNLAEALARRAQRRHELEQPCEPCLADLARAVELAPEREDLAELLGRWRKEAEIESDFWRESSQHFDLAYDGDRTEILHQSHRILDELEAGYTDLAELFGVLPVERSRARIRVVLYRREGFDELTGLGDWAGGAFDGTVRIPVTDLGREERALQGILRHELTHAFVLASGGARVPGWLNEGLAQWLEPGSERGIEGARGTLRGVELFSLEALTGSLARWKDAEQVARAYAQSLLLVDHLVRAYGERVVFRLVAGCAQGTPPAETFQALTRVSLETALADLAAEL